MNTICIVSAAAVISFSAAASNSEDTSVLDQIWGAARLYENDEARFIQSFALTGRLQGDAYSFGGNDRHNEDLVWRRLRFGFKTGFLQDFLIHLEGDFDLNEIENWDDFNNRITDAYLGWTPSKTITVKAGKQSAGFTLDGATSSKKLLVPERSIVAENLWFGTEYFTGASVYGNIGKFSYKLGGYSASGESGFGHFESGSFALLSGGMKMGEGGSLRLDYVFNDTDYDSDRGYGTKELDHVAALVYKQKLGDKAGLWSDIAGGVGNTHQGMSDLLGFQIMPFYDFTDALQLVFQYAVVTSLDDKADVSMARYASRNVGKTKVETAHNALVGFNWYLYGHKLKWQNAVEYNYGKNLGGTGDDYKGYGVTSALRLSW